MVHSLNYGKSTSLACLSTAIPYHTISGGVLSPRAEASCSGSTAQPHINRKVIEISQESSPMFLSQIIAQFNDLHRPVAWQHISLIKLLECLIRLYSNSARASCIKRCRLRAQQEMVFVICRLVCSVSQARLFVQSRRTGLTMTISFSSLSHTSLRNFVCGADSRVVNSLDCGARGPGFEYRCRQSDGQ